ncbi:putative uncharacterized protein [Clostridium sp. CAG:356]|nr:putative uncharacterized protein [Clostridium sp. CAG:356]
MYLKRLKDLREDKDLLQKDIADLLSIKQQQYSLYETGKRDLPLELAIILSDFYNTSIDYIVGKTNIKQPYKK